MLINPSLPWCIYQHKIENVCAFVGYCRLSELSQAHAAFRHREWRRFLKIGFSKIEIEIISQHASEREIVQMIDSIVQMYDPRVRLVHGPKKTIKETSTGEQFESIADAARLLGVPASAISSHLAGRYGYSHVKGHTFERLS